MEPLTVSAAVGRYSAVIALAILVAVVCLPASAAAKSDFTNAAIVEAANRNLLVRALTL